MTQRMWIFAMLLLTGGCATQLPETMPSGMPAQATGPELRVGDTWSYSVTDGFTKLPRGAIEYVVTAVQGDDVTVQVLQDGRESTENYTRSGNWLRRPATNMQTFTYSPAYPAFEFPLAPGKTWNSRVTATDPADGRNFPVTIEGVVLGWERIRVPAGEFDALKVRRVVYLDYWQLGVRGQSIIRETEWYAPAAKQVVRRETVSEYLSYIFGRNETGLLRVSGGRDGGGRPRYIQDDWLVYQLTSPTNR